MTRSVPVPLLAGVAVVLVLVVTLLIARSFNVGSSPVRCNTQHACVPAIDTPHAVVRS